MISLKQFIERHKGELVSVPWGYKGECVSLVQVYCNECYGIPFERRGNANTYCQNLVNAGLGKYVNKPERGDIISYDTPGDWNPYGHVAVVVSPSQIFHQWNTQPATYGNINQSQKTLKIVRLFGNRPADDPTPIPTNLKYKIGDKVILNGNLYSNSNATEVAGSVKNFESVIARVNPGSAHPYNFTGDLGWMSESSITKKEEPKPTPTPSASFKAGDKVQVVHPFIYGTNNKFNVYYNIYDVLEVNGDRVVIGIGSTVTAAVNAKNLKLAHSTMSARQFALEVWNEGKHGTGQARKDEAARLGVNYDEAQRLIDILANGGQI